MGLYDELERKIHAKTATDVERFMTGQNVQSEDVLGRLAARLGRSGASLKAGKALGTQERYGAHQITTAGNIELEKLKIWREEERRRRSPWRQLGSIVGSIGGFGLPGGQTLISKLLGLKTPESDLTKIFRYLYGEESEGLPTYQQPKFGGDLDIY